MNKKGFTLIELLAVIVILALIAIIAFPNVTKIIKGAKEDTNKVQFSIIEDALKDYITLHAATLSNGDNVCISHLKADGLLENKKIVNPDTNAEYTGCFTLAWDSAHNQFTYTYSN
jgi:type IV pilus assembly protein PilA